MPLQILRKVTRNPGFSLAAIACLTVGIATASAIGGILHSVLLAPLPYPQPDRLVTVWETAADVQEEDGRLARLSPDTVVDLREKVAGLKSVAALNTQSMTLSGVETARKLFGAKVSPNLFTDVLGIEAIHGRTFTSDDLEGEAVVLLGHGLWQRDFAGDPQVVGRTIRIDDKPARVVGVLPASVDFENPDPENLQPVEVWLPLDVESYQRFGRGLRFLTALGRMDRGVSRPQLEEELGALRRSLVEEAPAHHADWQFTVVPLDERLTAHVRHELLLLLGGVGLLLLTAAANFANLLLVRTIERQGEVSIRIALGGGRLRVLGSLLGESLLLSLLGGALGFVLALWLGESLLRLAPVGLPRLAQAELIPSTLSVAALISVVLAVLCVLPATVLTFRTSAAERLQGVGRGAAPATGIRLGQALVVAEIALSLTLLAASGMLLRSAWHLHQVDLGFDPDPVLTAELQLPPARYPEPSDILAFQRALLERVRSLESVEAAALVKDLPLTGRDTTVPLVVHPRVLEEDTPAMPVRLVSSGFFQTLGIRLLAGRPFEPTGGPDGPPEMVINRSMAARPEVGDSLNARLTVDWFGETLSGAVSGVAEDVRHHTPDELPEAAVYLPLERLPYPNTTLVVRSRSGNSRALVAPIRSIVSDLDPDLPVEHLEPMAVIVGRASARRNFLAILVTTFASAALLLACVGLYGVTAYVVQRSRRQIAIRMALGADRKSVFAMVIRRALAQTALGLLLGIVLVLISGRWLASQLFQVQTHDPLVLVVALGLLGCLALLAGYVPARRAIRLDPSTVLREE